MCNLSYTIVWLKGNKAYLKKYIMDENDNLSK